MLTETTEPQPCPKCNDQKVHPAFFTMDPEAGLYVNCPEHGRVRIDSLQPRKAEELPPEEEVSNAIGEAMQSAPTNGRAVILLQVDRTQPIRGFVFREVESHGSYLLAEVLDGQLQATRKLSEPLVTIPWSDPGFRNPLASAF